MSKSDEYIYNSAEIYGLLQTCFFYVNTGTRCILRSQMLVNKACRVHACSLSVHRITTKYILAVNFDIYDRVFPAIFLLSGDSAKSSLQPLLWLCESSGTGRRDAGQVLLAVFGL